MANKNTDDLFRKPRRTKGTPFYVERNYYAAGILALGGICWFLFELWPQAQKLKKSQLEEGKFDPSPETRRRFLVTELTTKPGYLELLSHLKARE